MIVITTRSRSPFQVELAAEVWRLETVELWDSFRLRYGDGVGITPSQPVAGKAESSIMPASAPVQSIEPGLLEELWRDSVGSSFGVARNELGEILLSIGCARNHGQPAGITPSPSQRAIFFRSLKISDLVLARACAQGNERAWEHFLAIYKLPLTRAAIAITGNETQGSDLADALYAELYGLSVRKTNGEATSEAARRCPLDSYQGRGSLIGWLRTILAQRHVDHHRRTWRESSLSDLAANEDANEYDPPAPEPEPASTPAELGMLGGAIELALKHLVAEERLLLASYYLDGRTLLQIARMLHVHEATVSRKLRRLTDDLRKQVLRNLQSAGLSKRAAQESLGADPRDLDLNLKKLLQSSQSEAFPEKAGL